MDIEILKKETWNKPSRVAFRQIRPNLYVSVKLIPMGNMCMNDEYEWKLGSERISESKARELLKSIEN